MLTNILFIFLLLTIYILIRINTITIVCTFIQDKYRTFTNIKSLISSYNNSSTLRIFIYSIKMLCHALYIAFIQYMNNSIIQLDKNTYELSYIVNGRLYKIIVQPKRGPIPILLISNELDEDITDTILPYIGPLYNWHNRLFTPAFFNCNTISFQMSNGSEYCFTRNSVMDISINN